MSLEVPASVTTLVLVPIASPARTAQVSHKNLVNLISLLLYYFHPQCVYCHVRQGLCQTQIAPFVKPLMFVSRTTHVRMEPLVSLVVTAIEITAALVQQATLGKLAMVRYKHLYPHRIYQTSLILFSFHYTCVHF